MLGLIWLDWAIIFGLFFETLGCGIGCCMLRGVDDPDENRNSSTGVGTLVVIIIFTIICLAILGFWNHFSLGKAIYWAENNWLTIAGYSAAYIVFGVAASVKWLGSWMRSRVKKFKNFRRLFLIGAGCDDANVEMSIPKDLTSQWVRHLTSHPTDKALGELPPFAKYRAYLGRRIAWWPLYLINWVLCDFLFDVLGKLGELAAAFASLFRKFYEQFAASYLRELEPYVPEKSVIGSPSLGE